jgi:phage/plasmid-like protein (TIGR03299 family)
MSHEIETMDVVGLRGQQAWHRLGVVIQDNLTALEAAERFGLTWKVDGYPLFAESPKAAAALETLADVIQSGASGGTILHALHEFQALRLEVETHKANVRTSDNDGNPVNELLGVVGADYQVCQNRELAEFTDALAQSGKVTIESCGSIRNGKRVWFLAKGDAFTIGGTDEVLPYVLVSNGHDGGQSIRVTPTTVRVVCSNTLHMVIPNAEDMLTRPDSAAISIRHSGKISDKLQQAKRALAYYGDTLRRNRELFDMLQAKQFDQQQNLQLFADSYASFWEVATPDELSSADSKIRRIAENRMERMRKASDAFIQRYENEKRLTGLQDSAWLALNAMTGYIQHDKVARGSDDTDRVSRRMESNLFGINASRTNDVLAHCLALAG